MKKTLSLFTIILLSYWIAYLFFGTLIGIILFRKEIFLKMRDFTEKTFQRIKMMKDKYSK